VNDEGEVTLDDTGLHRTDREGPSKHDLKGYERMIVQGR